VALTETQKTKVRMYLGYERGFDLNSRLESRMISFSAEEETEVGSVLVDLGDIDTKLKTVALNNLDLEKAEDVTFRGPEQLDALREFGRSLIQRLVALTGVEAAIDFYGSDAGGAGGVIPFGG
jgi:hypothetical protein